jgi:hypothetical protein
MSEKAPQATFSNELEEQRADSSPSKDGGSGVAASAMTSPSHKEPHCRRVFLDLAPLDLIRHPRHAVVSAIAM